MFKFRQKRGGKIIIFILRFKIFITSKISKLETTVNTLALNDLPSLATKHTPGFAISDNHLLRENAEQNSMYPSSDSINLGIFKNYFEILHYSDFFKICYYYLANSTTFTTGQDIKLASSVKHNRVYWRMARVLLLMSISFLVLNSPVFILQICHFQRNDIFSSLFGFTTESNITTNQDPNIHTSLLVELLERFAYYVYYLHFSVNFIIFDRLSIFKKSN